MFKKTRNTKEKGQGLVEYALILVLVSVAVLGVLLILGPMIGNVFTEINSTMTTAGGEAEADPCVALLDTWTATNTAYQVCGGNQSSCPSEYTAVVNAYNAYSAAGCFG